MRDLKKKALTICYIQAKVTPCCWCPATQGDETTDIENVQSRVPSMTAKPEHRSSPQSRVDCGNLGPNPGQ